MIVQDPETFLKFEAKIAAVKDMPFDWILVHKQLSAFFGKESYVAKFELAFSQRREKFSKGAVVQCLRPSDKEFILVFTNEIRRQQAPVIAVRYILAKQNHRTAKGAWTRRCQRIAELAHEWKTFLMIREREYHDNASMMISMYKTIPYYIYYIQTQNLSDVSPLEKTHCQLAGGHLAEHNWTSQCFRYAREVLNLQTNFLAMLDAYSLEDNPGKEEVLAALDMQHSLSYFLAGLVYDIVAELRDTHAAILVSIFRSEKIRNRAEMKRNIGGEGEWHVLSGKDLYDKVGARAIQNMLDHFTKR